MAITLRGVKGSALTHDELDNNFREFFYSGSIDGSELKLFRSRSIDPVFTLPRTSPSGQQFAIQVKSGSATSGSNSLFTGSDNFTYDFGNNILRVTGSSYYSGNIEVIGSVTATEFKTTLISSSIVFSSGSTLFGDTSDDTHTFTGSLKVSNGITGSLLSTNGVLSGSIQIASEISGSSTTLSASLASDIAVNTAASASLSSRVTTNSSSIATNVNNIASLTAATSSYLLNTTDTLTGDLTVTGTLTANTYVVSSSVTYLTTSFSSGSTQFGDSADDTHTFTGSVNILGSLGITGFPDVSASLASAISASGTSNVSINNNANNRIITATGTDTLNGESNLTFNGSTLGVSGSLTVIGDGTINGTKITKFTSSDTDITGLIGGTNTGTLIQGVSTGHFVIGMQEDSLTDSFAIIGGAGDFYSNTNYDKLIFKVSGSGQTYIGGALSVDGALDVDGTITATNDITAYFSSDERLKDNITPIGDAINKLNQIGGYEFDWNNNSEHSGHDVGVIAQEIEKVLPEVVTTRDNGYMAVRYEKIVALLIQAVKEQQLQIEELKSKL